ncbi:unnamed protein product, partial [Rotaria magnacalcarata]
MRDVVSPYVNSCVSSNHDEKRTKAIGSSCFKLVGS